MNGAKLSVPRTATSNALASRTRIATNAIARSSTCEPNADRLCRPQVAEVAVVPEAARFPQLPPDPLSDRWSRRARTPPRPPTRRCGSPEEPLEPALERFRVGRREAHAGLGLVVRALEHVQAVAVETLRQRARTRVRTTFTSRPPRAPSDGARPSPWRGRPARLRRRGGAFAQDRHDLQADVVGERARLLGLGDDEDVVRLVVGHREVEETVDGRRNARQASTVRKLT